MSKQVTWIDNVLATDRGDLFTVLPDGTLEIRGKCWDRRRRKGESPDSDRPRVCRFENEMQARKVAELVAEITTNPV